MLLGVALVNIYCEATTDFITVLGGDPAELAALARRFTGPRRLERLDDADGGTVAAAVVPAASLAWQASHSRLGSAGPPPPGSGATITP